MDIEEAVKSTGDKEEQLQVKFAELIALIESSRPGDRSAKDRRYSVLTTRVEVDFAYFFTYILNYIDTK